MANTYYIDWVNGSDSNTGLVRSLPRKTLLADGAFASGDTQIILSDIWSSTGSYVNIIYNNKVGCTLKAETRNTYYIRSDKLIGDLFISIGGGKFTTNIGAGIVGGGGSKALNHVAYKWRASINSYGSHFGHLKYAAGTAAIGTYEYNDTTGLLTINTGTAPVVAEDVSWNNAASNTILVEFIGGSDNIMENLTFAPMVTVPGYNAIFSNSPRSKYKNCIFHDGGNHNCGLYDGSATPVDTDYIIEDCEFHGGRGDNSLIVFYRESTAGSDAKLDIYRSKFYIHRYFGIDGTAATGPESAAGLSMFGFLAHSNNSAQMFSRVRLIDCEIYQCEAGLPSPGGMSEYTNGTYTWDPLTYPLQFIRCRIGHIDGTTGFTIWRISSPIGLSKCDLDFRNAGPSTSCRAGGFGSVSLFNAGPVCMDSCNFKTNLDDGANTVLGLVLIAASDKLYLVNTSMKDFGTNPNNASRPLICLNGGTQELHIRGSLFVYSVARTNNGFIFYNDNAVLDIQDNGYFGIGDSVWTTVAANNTQAEFTSLIDTSADILASDPFVNSDLGINSASSAWALRRNVTDHLPLYGSINNQSYHGYLGSHQYINSQSIGHLVINNLRIPALD